MDIIREFWLVSWEYTLNLILILFLLDKVKICKAIKVNKIYRNVHILLQQNLIISDSTA